jgi:citrate lyase subunit beta/citryl-CoA lyase
VGHERSRDDLGSVVRQGLEGLVVPKVETPEQIKTVEEILDRREPEVGLSRGSVRLLVAIESPRGLFNAYSIATASPRVIGLIFGAEDFSRELSLPLRREGEARDLIYARSALVTAAACAHVQAVDGVWPDLQDTEGLKTFALQSRRLGFSGMSLIHPAQVDTVNAAFTPAADEIDYARGVLKAFDEARARGEGAVAFGGQLLDLPIVDRARQTLELADSLSTRSS